MIFNYSHYDLDGNVSQLILKKIYSKVIHRQSGYTKIDKMLDFLVEKSKEFPDENNTIIITDLNINHEKVNALIPSFNKVIYIDHHTESLENKDKYKCRTLISKKMCGAALTFKFFRDQINEKINTNEINAIKKLIAYTNDYDLWEHKSKKSYALNALFWNMTWNKFQQRFWRGFNDFTEDEMNFLSNKKKEVLHQIETQEQYSIGDHGLAVFPAVGVGNAISNDFTLFKPDFKYYFFYLEEMSSLAIRLRDVKTPFQELVEIAHNDSELGKMIDDWGGHPYAGRITITDKYNTRENVVKIMNKLYEIGIEKDQ